MSNGRNPTTPVTPGPILPEDPAYPKYFVEFSGGSLTNPIKVTGPHTFTLLQADGSTLTVTFSRHPTELGRPNLSVKFG